MVGQLTSYIFLTSNRMLRSGSNIKNVVIKINPEDLATGLNVCQTYMCCEDFSQVIAISMLNSFAAYSANRVPELIELKKILCCDISFQGPKVFGNPNGLIVDSLLPKLSDDETKVLHPHLIE